MARTPINPLLKSALELGPVLAFFGAYLWLKDRVFAFGGTEYEGFIVVTAGFIPVFLLATGVLWKLTGHLSRMQLVTAVLIVVFGGLSVWLNDDRFFKMKPTLIYLLFGGALAIGLMRGESHCLTTIISLGFMMLRNFCVRRIYSTMSNFYHQSNVEFMGIDFYYETI